MSAFRQTKHPAEQIPIGTDWTDALEPAETVVTPTVSIVVQHGPDANPAALISGAPAVNVAPITVTEDGVSRTVAIGKAVSQRVIDGLPGVVYETRWVVVTSLNRTLEKRIDLIVE